MDPLGGFHGHVEERIVGDQGFESAWVIVIVARREAGAGWGGGRLGETQRGERQIRVIDI